MTSFRNLKDEDDMALIARGIYETDKLLFNQLFGKKEIAIVGIKKLIKSRYINEYHRSFITVVYDEDPEQVEGFIVSYKGNEVNPESTYYAFEDTGLTYTPAILLSNVLGKIFTSNIGRNDYYIGNVYVFRRYRNRGHGSRLVEKAKQKARYKNTRCVLLDLDYDKKDLLNFFARLGFEKDSKNYHKILGTIYGNFGLKCEIR